MRNIIGNLESKLKDQDKNDEQFKGAIKKEQQLFSKRVETTLYDVNERMDIIENMTRKFDDEQSTLKE